MKIHFPWSDDDQLNPLLFEEEEEEEEVDEDEDDDEGDGKEGNEDDDEGDEEEDGKDGDEDEDEDDDEGDDDEEELDPEKYEVKTRGVSKKEDEDDDEGDDDLDEETRKKIDKRVDKRLSPYEQKIQRQNDEIEVNTFIIDNPEFKRYKKVALKHLEDPAYRNIPVENIMAMVAHKDLLKLGAEKERAAQKKAKQTKNGGRTTRKQPKGKVDWSTASQEEVERKIQEVKQQRRD